MNVLFVVWELDPFFKMGGLGDVARSLPQALRELGTDIRIMTPYYKVAKMGRTKKSMIAKVIVPYAGRNEKVEVWELVHPQTQVTSYFLKNTRYLDKNISLDTWGFFDKAVVSIIKENNLSWTPEILHLNDLHCGLIPLFLEQEKVKMKTILTIHNLAYQGRTSVEIMNRAGIDPEACKMVLWETKNRQINFLLEGIIHADVITTVSPTYAKEILTEQTGAGLDDVLRGKEGRIFGILNGIDINWRYIWHDKAVKYAYGLTPHTNGDVTKKYYDWKEGKTRNKEFLQKKLGLKVDKKIPLFCFIGRFDAGQKGLDILHTMLRKLDQTSFECVILGSGDISWEERFKWLSTFYPKNISCNFRYDETLAHQIYAASDFILIPSRYEPCGLIQMIAMLFGTVPIAHKVGGLRDSIRDEVNGFLFDSYSAEQLERTTSKAIDVWKNDKKKFEKIVESALSTDFSWKKSAQSYLDIYDKLLGNGF